MPTYKQLMQLRGQAFPGTELAIAIDYLLYGPAHGEQRDLDKDRAVVEAEIQRRHGETIHS